MIGAEVELPGDAGRKQVRFALEPVPGDPPAPEADLVAEGIEPMPGGGTRFRARGGGVDADVELAVPGRHNVANALAALGALAAAGADPRRAPRRSAASAASPGGSS